MVFNFFIKTDRFPTGDWNVQTHPGEPEEEGDE